MNDPLIRLSQHQQTWTPQAITERAGPRRPAAGAAKATL